MGLTGPQRSEDTFLQPQYAGLLLPRLGQLKADDEPLGPDDAIVWAEERELNEVRQGMLVGVAWVVRYGD